MWRTTYSDHILGLLYSALVIGILVWKSVHRTAQSKARTNLNSAADSKYDAVPFLPPAQTPSVVPLDPSDT